jgi:hypothetical protein
MVPEPGNVLDYHRYSYTRFNPLKYNDPTGHISAVGQAAFDPAGGGGGLLAIGALTSASIALNSNLADHPPAFPEINLPIWQESYPLSRAQVTVTSYPLGASEEPTLLVTEPSGSQTLKLVTPLPEIDPAAHIVYHEVERAKELHALRPVGPTRHSQTETTTAVISAIAPDGNLVYLVANNYGLMREQVNALTPNEVAVPTNREQRGVHPEMQILQYAGMWGYKPLRAGASWSICDRCAPILEQNGVEVLNPRTK